MDQVYDSEDQSSSGCESGWTLYLDEHTSCKNASFARHEHDQEHYNHEEEEEEDDDDMSMVSDASSGPPHDLQEHQEQDEDEQDGVFCDPNLVFGSRKRRKILKQTSFYGHRHLQDLPASFDDTASSPFFTFYDKDLKMCNKEGLMEDGNSFGYSQGHSTTYYEIV